MTDDTQLQGPLDTAALDELRDYGAEILIELIDIFLDDTPNRLRELQAAVMAGDAHATEQAAHALKSACAQLGAANLSTMCRDLEAKGRAGDLDGAPALVVRALTEWQRVESALTAEKNAAS